MRQPTGCGGSDAPPCSSHFACGDGGEGAGGQGGVPGPAPIKLLTWNIERGYQLEAIIEELLRLDADVISLQEIDMHCERSNWEDTGRAIARRLGLNYVFLCEFEELYSPLRQPSAQGGGVHGNAVLSKFDITSVEAVPHVVGAPEALPDPRK
ncbi:hypothetical protein FOA52_009016 [Chlamydomonas sp. UWO 241]|nr:hypothetical protein FOA52_009016 [Chlamydomonas sp. UWO 241]